MVYETFEELEIQLKNIIFSNKNIFLALCSDSLNKSLYQRTFKSLSKNAGVPAALSTDQFPAFLIDFDKKWAINHRGFWKLNISIIYNSEYALKIKDLIQNLKFIQ